MSKNTQHTIQNSLRKWISGNASPADNRMLSDKSKNDPFLSDAMDGFRQKKENHSANLERVQTLLRNRYTQKKNKKLMFYITRIAAGAAILVIGFWGISQFFSSKDSTISKVETLDNAILPTNAEQTREIVTPTPENEKVAENIVPSSTATTPTKTTKKRNIAASRVELAESSIDYSVSEVIILEDEHLVYSAPEIVYEDIVPVQEVEGIIMYDAPSEMASYAVSIEQNVPISGVILDASNKPIGGVTIYEINTSNKVKSDKNGKFDMILGWSNNPLLISPKAFRDSIYYPHLYEENQLILADSVEGSRVKKKAKRAKAIPNIGFLQYKKYVKESIQYPETLPSPPKGKVKLEFILSEEGIPTTFTIVKSLNDALDSEAIRLLREGPKWHYKKETTLQPRSRYSIKFKPKKKK